MYIVANKSSWLQLNIRSPGRLQKTGPTCGPDKLHKLPKWALVELVLRTKWCGGTPGSPHRFFGSNQALKSLSAEFFCIASAFLFPCLLLLLGFTCFVREAAFIFCCCWSFGYVFWFWVFFSSFLFFGCFFFFWLLFLVVECLAM